MVEQSTTVRNRRYDALDVVIAPTAEQMGQLAAEEFARVVKAALAERDETAVVLAAQASSQRTFIDAIIARTDIEWSRISVFQVDEYVGIPDEHPLSGRSRTRNNLIRHVNPKAFHGMRAEHQPIEEELERYSQLLRDAKPVICVAGIGESGHMAFNDPPGDFDTNRLVWVAALSEISRRQILKGVDFGSLEAVPKYGMTITMPGLLLPETVLVVVPTLSKAEIIRKVLEEPVSIMCPASVLRRTQHARLYLDESAAALLS